MMCIIKKYTPKIGLRIVKSAVAIYICFLFYFFIDKQGIIFYSQLAALWCIQPQKETMAAKAFQRTVGTLAGAAVGLIVLLIDQNYVAKGVRGELVYGLIVAVAVVVVINITLIVHKKDASYFSCVVLLSIVVVHIGDANPYSFVLSRVADTMIGIIIGMSVNSFHLPRKKIKDILFISGIDDTLLVESEKLSSYSYVELNRMLKDGANFTISTKRTPASIIELMRGVNLKLPVIAMDGAVLYSISKNEYVRTYIISKETVAGVRKILDQFDINYFMNMLIDNTLIIQYKKITSDAERDIFDTLSKSPYRNYVNCDLASQANCIYFMIIDKEDKIEKINEALGKTEYNQKLRIVTYPSDDYPGYAYIKIYNKNATRENMIQYLKKMTGIQRCITFGSIENVYDVVVKAYDNDKVVSTLKKMYAPVRWKRMFF